MGNYHSSFEFPIRRQLSTLTWDAIQRAWANVETVIPGQVDHNTTIQRSQFTTLFTDDSGAAAGKYSEAPLSVFRAFDAAYRNSVNLYGFFCLVALFCSSPTGAADARWQWVLRLFGTSAAADPDDAMTVKEIITAITCLNSTMNVIGLVARPCDAEEAQDIVAGCQKYLELFAEQGKVPISKLIKWLHTESAMHNLVTRFTMLLEQFEKMSDAEQLPQLLAIPDAPFHKGKGGGKRAAKRRTAAEEEEVRLKALNAVSARPVLAKLSYNTGLTMPELMRLKREFGGGSNKTGTLDVEAFKEIMTKIFPALADEEQGDGSGTGDDDGAGGSMGGLLPTMHRSTLEKLFDAFDADASGVIEFREFILGCAKMARGSIREKTELLFGLLDLDGDGTVTVTELTRFIEGGALELQEIMNHAHGLVEHITPKTPGMITETEFVHLLLQDPALPGWFASVTHSAPLMLVHKALDDIAELLLLGNNPTAGASLARRTSIVGASQLASPTTADSGAGAGSSPGETGRPPSRRGSITDPQNPQSRRNSGAVPSPVTVPPTPAAVTAVFGYPALLGFWSERLMTVGREAKKRAANQGITIPGLSGRVPTRVGLPGGVNGPRRPESQLVLREQIGVEDMMALLTYAFELEERTPRAINGFKSACKFLFEAIAAAASPDDGTATSAASRAARAAALERGHAQARADAKAAGRQGSLLAPAGVDTVSAHAELSTMLVPTRLVLHILGLSLATTPEELALVLYRNADTDDDGSITPEELQRFIVAQHASSTSVMSAAQIVLSQLDIDGDGIISEMEFRAGLTKHPSLFEAFGVLFGGTGGVPPMQTEPQYRLGPLRRPGSSGNLDTDGQGLSLNTTGPRMSTWAFDGTASSGAFAGLNVLTFGEGDPDSPDAQAYQRMDLQEKLTLRRRRYERAGTALEKNLERLKGDVRGAVHTVRPVMDSAVRRIGAEVQEHKVGVHMARRLLKDLDEQRAAKGRPGSARPAGSSGTVGTASRPGSAPMGGRPQTAGTTRRGLKPPVVTGVFARLSPERPASAKPVFSKQQRDRDGVPLPEGQAGWKNSVPVAHPLTAYGDLAILEEITPVRSRPGTASANGRPGTASMRPGTARPGSAAVCGRPQ